MPPGRLIVKPLRIRLATAAVLLALTLLAVHATSPYPSLALGGLLLYCCVWELADLMEITPKWVLMGAAVLAGLALVLVSGQTKPWAACLLGLAVGVASLLRRFAKGRASGTDYLSVFWVVAPLYAGITLQQVSAGMSPGHAFAPNLVLLAAGPLWIGDTAALVFGKRFGKHLMAPSVSPNKTWEGAAAHFTFATITGVVLSFFIGPPWWIGALVGAVGGITGQIGDLLQSALKRAVGRKDSGGLLPGHGGVLDRMDAFLIAMPVLFAMLYLLRSRL